MIAHGCACDTYWTDGAAVTEEKFNSVFPDVAKATDRRRILDDPDITMILISAVPADRAQLAIEAMEAGKDVMENKANRVGEGAFHLVVDHTQKLQRLIRAFLVIMPAFLLECRAGEQRIKNHVTVDVHDVEIFFQVSGGKRIVGDICPGHGV